MQNKELVLLLKEHTEMQKIANCLYGRILEELVKRGLLEKADVLSCLNVTEPSAWEETIIALICK